MTPSNDDMFGLAPITSDDHPISYLFNYRAENGEDSWNGVNGAVAGVLVIGACVIGLGCFVYQKRKKNDSVRPQSYECLAKIG